MTYEEAIYCLTVMRNEVLDTWEFDFSNEETDALGLALEAMELQVAKKIKKIKVGSNGIEYTKYICPSCNSVIKAAPSSWQFIESCHCKVCGQKLEGSEE